MCLEELGVRAKSGRRMFEDVGSPSKIPKAESSIPKQFPAARGVAHYEHNDGMEVK